MDNLNFYNKNSFRNYPLQQTATITSNEGKAIPADLIVGMSLSTIYAQSDLYISHIAVRNTFLSIAIVDSSTGVAVGSFNGNITSDYQTLPLTSAQNYTAGSCVVGHIATLIDLQGSWNFTYAASKIEPSCVLWHNLPNISGLTYHGQRVAGNITLNLTNISANGNMLSIIDNSTMLANNDFTMLTGCPTPFLFSISGVTPNSAGNIDIYGILPIKVSIDAGSIVVNSPTYTLDVGCPAKTLMTPPLNTSNTYYTDILTATSPEYKLW